MYAPGARAVGVLESASLSAHLALHSITVAHKLLEESKLA